MSGTEVRYGRDRVAAEAVDRLIADQLGAAGWADWSGWAELDAAGRRALLRERGVTVTRVGKRLMMAQGGKEAATFLRLENPPPQDPPQGSRDGRPWTQTWLTLTTLGSYYGLSAIAAGRELDRLGLRKDGKPSAAAEEGGFITSAVKSGGIRYYRWHAAKTRAALDAAGLARVHPGQARKARKEAAEEKEAREYASTIRRDISSADGTRQKMGYVLWDTVPDELAERVNELVSRKKTVTAAGEQTAGTPEPAAQQDDVPGTELALAQATALEMLAGRSTEELAALWQRADENVAWLKGDIALTVATSYGGKELERFAGLVGVPCKTAEAYRTVAAAWPRSTRRLGFSWSVHQALAPLPDRAAILAAIPDGQSLTLANARQIVRDRRPAPVRPPEHRQSARTDPPAPVRRPEPVISQPVITEPVTAEPDGPVTGTPVVMAPQVSEPAPEPAVIPETPADLIWRMLAADDPWTPQRAARLAGALHKHLGADALALVAKAVQAELGGSGR